MQQTGQKNGVVDPKQRFAFGKNWAAFLGCLDEDRIAGAQKALVELLGRSNLVGMSFLDIGSGSGLSSLVARRLGARVHSFDYDAESVACTKELKRRYFPDDSNWRIEQGSVLDRDLMHGLGRFDIVYSWGVLHHTGAMWVGIESAIGRLADDGVLFIAIYNDQGWKSHFWWFVKFVYNKLPSPINRVYGYVFGVLIELANITKYSIRLKPMEAIGPLLNYKRKRGMSVFHDMLDWMGGFPYEFATYDVLLRYMLERDLEFIGGKRAASLGCHELVFRKSGRDVTTK